MAYDEDLANRIRTLIAGEPDVSELRMFGGLAFLVGGKMAVAAGGQGALMVRVDPGRAEALEDRTDARPFEMRGRPVKGWLHVDAEHVGTTADLEPWVTLGVAYARSLPADSRSTQGQSSAASAMERNSKPSSASSSPPG